MAEDLFQQTWLQVAERIARYELEARDARIELQGPHVVLRGAGETLRLGRHLDDEARVRFAAELKKRLCT